MSCWEWVDGSLLSSCTVVIGSELVGGEVNVGLKELGSSLLLRIQGVNGSGLPEPNRDHKMTTAPSRQRYFTGRNAVALPAHFAVTGITR
jgi:hypothetical protein